jgi:membrane protein
LGVGVNILLAIAVLTGLPRLRLRLRRVLAPALLIAAGLEILKTAGRLYVQRTEANPAYHVVAGAVAVLVFLSLLNQLILFAAALTATSTRGPVTDLAARRTHASRHPTATAGAHAHPRLSRRRRPVRRHRRGAPAPPVAVVAAQVPARRHSTKQVGESAPRPANALSDVRCDS